jgi:hypothetical protein
LRALNVVDVKFRAVRSQFTQAEDRDPLNHEKQDRAQEETQKNA